MSHPPDWKGIASRIHGLISMSDRGEISTAASRLGVSEQELRDTLKHGSSSSVLKVVRAVVRLYGLDPTWVLTGQYDPSTHRSALSRDETEIDRTLTLLTGEHELPPPSQATDKS